MQESIHELCKMAEPTRPNWVPKWLPGQPDWIRPANQPETITSLLRHAESRDQYNIEIVDAVKKSDPNQIEMEVLGAWSDDTSITWEVDLGQDPVTRVERSEFPLRHVKVVRTSVTDCHMSCHIIDQNGKSAYIPYCNPYACTNFCEHRAFILRKEFRFAPKVIFDMAINPEEMSRQLLAFKGLS